MSTAQDAIARMRSKLGTRESPPDSNRCWATDWYGLVGPWCAMSASWAVITSGGDLPGKTTPKGFAYVPYIESSGRRYGRWYGHGDGAIGDLVCYDWNGDGVGDHVEIVTGVNLIGRDRYVVSVGGNTGSANLSNGGMVVEHQFREATCVRGYYRPVYGGPPAAAVRPAGPRDLQRGDSGQDVWNLQFTINFKGGEKVTIDGDFGPSTEHAVRTWQGGHHLTIDGIVGAATRASLATAPVVTR